MTRAHPPCAMCARFKITGHEAQAAAGNGWCEAWEKYVPWNGQIGVLFVAAKHEEPRRAFAAKHAAKTENTCAVSA